jgi:hypothetical protein
MSGREMVAAVVARLTDQVPATLTVHEGETFRGQTPPLPYVVVHAGIGTPSAPQLSGGRTHRELEVQVVAVGESVDQVRWAGEQVDAALVGWAPTITGLTCWKVDQAYANVPRPDTDVPEHPSQVMQLGYTVQARSHG